MRKAARETLPPVTAKDLLLHDLVASARQNVQVPDRIDLARDLVEGHAIEKGVRQAMRVIVGDQLTDRSDIADEIPDGDTAVCGLRSGDA